MAKKVLKTFTATIKLNPEKGGAWLAYVSLTTPLDQGLNSMPETETQSSQAAWKNASAAKRWVKAQVLEMTPRKSVKWTADDSIVDAKGKPASFTGVLQFKA